QDDIQEFSWQPVLKIFTFLKEEDAAALAGNTRAVLQFMVTDKDNSNSVLNMVTQARENGRSVQDHITKEMWQCLNEFYHIIRQERLTDLLQKEDPVTVLDTLIKQGLLYFGTTDVTMARGEGNSFINMGKFLERANQSVDILNIKFADINYELDKPADTTYWKYFLMSISGYELYLKTYRSGFVAKNVMEQILLNETFPRSVIYSIIHLHQNFERLKNEKNIAGFNQVDFMIGKLKSNIKFSTPDALMEDGLHLFLTDTKASLFEIGRTLNQNYFAHS
ncbi:MAG: alpha-E domain-containing protein, partial [Gloeobacteraceae cyanobacterium ES-bin-316]|nr:alpha-E domain-containing protein [Ferruginibacter sp.]